MSDHKKSLVEQHAIDRLHKVEKEQRKAYVKPPSHFQWQNLVMVVILLIVLVTMIIGIL